MIRTGQSKACEIELHPAGAEVQRLGDWPPVANVTRITDRDAVDMPVLRDRADAFHERVGSEVLSRGKFDFLGLVRLPDFDVRAADIKDQCIHGSWTGRAINGKAV